MLVINYLGDYFFFLLLIIIIISFHIDLAIGLADRLLLILLGMPVVACTASCNNLLQLS